MAEHTEIAWCDSTFNPWIGCTKVSPGCANCYAENQTFVRAARANGRELWGAGKPRHRTSEAYWRQPRRWDTMRACAHCGHLVGGGFPAWCPECGPSTDLEWRRPRVFCASLADWLDDEVPVEWLADLLDLIRRTPHLDWLLLTKRPQQWRKRMAEVQSSAVNNVKPYAVCDMIEAWFGGTPPSNIWIGTTVEDQQRADERIPAMLKIPARVRFVSAEPMLGPVVLGPRAMAGAGTFRHMEGIDWVICGGESGPKARPMHPEWARSLRDQCAAAGVPFLFKQLGEWAPAANLTERSTKPAFIFPDDTAMLRVGKRAAGRLLDGRKHNEFPEVRRD